jgi:hypothetical protein
VPFLSYRFHFINQGVNMKNTTLTLSTVFAAAILFGYTGVRAHEGEDHAKSGMRSMDSARAGEGMSALYVHLQEIDAQLTAGDLGGMHEHAEAIEAATKDLDKDTTLDATRKKRVEGYVKNVNKLADKLHDAADEKKLDETKKAFGQLKAQVDLLDKQFAHSHKPGVNVKHVQAGHHKEAIK